MPTKTKRNPAPEAVTPTPAPVEIPDWVNTTPPENTFSLTMFDTGGDGATQNIDLTREEFIELKEHLAAMRGYAQEPKSAA